MMIFNLVGGAFIPSIAVKGHNCEEPGFPMILYITHFSSLVSEGLRSTLYTRYIIYSHDGGSPKGLRS